MNLSTRTKLNEQVDQAARHIRAGRPHLAIRMAWHLLRRQPGHVPARLLIADAMIRVDDFNHAVHHLDIADTYLRSDDVRWPNRHRVRQLVLRGRAIQRLGRTADAIDCWREATAINPRCVSALRHLSVVLHGEGLHDQAMRDADRLLAIRPNDEPTMKLVASAAEAIGDHGRAIDMLREIARRRAARKGRGQGMRFTRDECLRLARLMRRADRIADAIDLFNHLADDVADDAELACEWASLAVEVGDEPRAEQLLRTALRVQPRHRQALAMRGRQKMRTGRFVEAGRIWWRLHQLDRHAVEPLAHLLVCSVQAMRHTLTERIERRYQQTADATDRRAAIADAWRTAVPGEVFADLLERRDTDGDIGVLDGLLREAVDTFENVVPEHREYADVHYHLAVCHEATGEATGAADCYDRALRINPGYIDAACRRARQLLDEGFTDAADAVIASALDRHPHDERLTELRRLIEAARPSNITADAA